MSPDGRPSTDHEASPSAASPSGEAAALGEAERSGPAARSGEAARSGPTASSGAAPTAAGSDPADGTSPSAVRTRVAADAGTDPETLPSFDEALTPGHVPGHRRPRAWSAGRRLADGWGQLPGWGQALAVFVLSRWVDFLIISRVGRFQVPSLWTAPDPGYQGMLSLWDGDWYRRVAEHGYPSHLPIDAAGNVAQNEWAFYPLYPYTVRFVMRMLGAGWPVAASLVSLACAGLAVIVMRNLVEQVAGRSLALWTVILFCAFPSAPVLQLAYTESLSVLLLVCALWCLQRRQYLLAAPVMLLIGLARPIAVPLAAVVGLHVVSRLWRRRQEPVSRVEYLAMGVLLLASALAAAEWTLIVAVVTGTPDGYTQTMAAWRAGHVIEFLKPWWTMSRYFLGDWVGPGVVAVVVLIAVWWLTRPQARAIAGDLRAWVVCYLGYLGVVLDPSTSLPRYLLLLFPFGTMLAAASPSPAYRRTLALAFVAGQILWVSWLWRFSPPTDWPP